MAASPGSFKDYDAKDIPSEASFLEMLDIVNEALHRTWRGSDRVRFGLPRGYLRNLFTGHQWHPSWTWQRKTTCQLYMRRFTDGDTIWIEPFRAAAFPPIKDLVVDRSAFDRIIEAGGYIVVRTGSAPGSKRVAGAEACCGPRDGSRRLHWMRRLRGGLPEFLCDVVRFRQSLASRTFAARSGGTRKPSPPYGSENG